MKKLIYLASPYSHESSRVREQRFQFACQAAGKLMQQGFFIFSPIAMTHSICVENDLPFEFDFYQEFDHLMVDKCDAILVLKLRGWEGSKGVAAEIEYAVKTHKDVIYIDPDDIADFGQKAGEYLVWNKQSS